MSAGALRSSAITVKIKLLSTARGGREQPIPQGEYRGILSARGQHFSFTCVVPFEGGMEPGLSYRLDIAFLFPDLALPFFGAGCEFNLWETGTIGYGRVVRAFVTGVPL